jgi:hypothetical protein
MVAIAVLGAAAIWRWLGTDPFVMTHWVSSEPDAVTPWADEEHWPSWISVALLTSAGLGLLLLALPKRKRGVNPGPTQGSARSL